LVVADLAAAIAFYRVRLGIALVEWGRAAGAYGSATLSLAVVTLRLEQPAHPGRRYPSEGSANDPWPQHFAIRVADVGAAYARLSEQPFTAISTGGSQELPASSGSVIAFKFRDSDGHPLEQSHYSDERPTTGSLFLSIDHSAIAVRDIEASIASYRDRLGFRVAERLINQGPTQ
jgi:catechol 2,3-dioxygenase-like lactoylglutathione lyase family enzyme